MGIKRIIKRSILLAAEKQVRSDVPKGHIAVYIIGEGQKQKKRVVIPISYLNHPLFQHLLSKAEEEFGFHHPMGALTIPCNEDYFFNLTSRLRA
uniref:Auxin-responsive protein SAUR21-like n=1 Tax=Nelumbo nucifera TaxID=4432 RepID=A0A822ZAJ7_NELNU|nr:TPA_asm: hypothetical protein HUJ06_014798 [Nelumbo nucifera]